MSAILLELAERCEKATGADRKIDTAIENALDRPGTVAFYTASLDAALTLVPEGKRWMVQTLMTGKYRAEADWNGHGNCCTPALALCAAALRARAASAIEARRAGTPQSDPVHESAIPQGDAQNTPSTGAA